jgi:hypothetical protein
VTGSKDVDLVARTSGVEGRVRLLSRAMGYHGGGVRLEQVSPEGDVKLRYVGMCSGCVTRAQCGTYTVIPAMLAVEGVRSVELPGARLSDEARARLEAAFGRRQQPRQPGGGAA